MSMPRWLGRGMLAWLLWRVFGREPAPSYSPDQRHPWPVPGRSLFVGERELFYRRLNEGGGSPIVLIHGWGDHSVVVWHRIAPRLALTRDVILLDQRNHGRSQHRRGRFEIDDLADDAAAVMRALDLGPADVVGYSMGGMVVQSLAVRYPHLVRSVILGGTTAGGAPPWQRRAARFAFWLGRSIDRVSRVELSFLRYWYLMQNRVVPPEHAEWLWNEQMERDPELYWETGFAAARFDSRDWVGRLRAPTLVVIPTKDQLVPPSEQYDLARRVLAAQVVEIHAGRHEAPLTHALEIAVEIDRFTKSADVAEAVRDRRSG